MRVLRRASRRRPRSRRFDDSTSSRSVSVRPVFSVSTRHQHSNPQSRSSSTRNRGTPVPARRGSPVSRSKNPSKIAADPVRSGSPSRQSSRMTHGVPDRTSSGLRPARARPPRRARRSRVPSPRSRGASPRSRDGVPRSRGATRRSDGPGRSPRGAFGRSGCAGA